MAVCPRDPINSLVLDSFIWPLLQAEIDGAEQKAARRPGGGAAAVIDSIA